MKHTDPEYWDQWLPDPAHINALPERVRKFIHDLAARVDPAGDTQTLSMLRDENAMLRKKIEELIARGPTQEKET